MDNLVLPEAIVPQRMADPALKVRWLEALRSKKYEQTRGRLKRITTVTADYTPGYCCMGVLCDIVDSTKWHEVEAFTGSISAGWGDNMTMNYPPNSLGLDEVAQVMLGQMNDEREFTFEQIADWVEANL